MAFTKMRESLNLLLRSLLLLIFWLSFTSSAFPYAKLVKPKADPKEIESLFYMSLSQGKYKKWYIVPTNIYLTKVVLAPPEDFLIPMYIIDLQYPLKSILYQSFLEMNLRYLLADQMQALIDYRQELAKLKEFQEKGKQYFGPYWRQNFNLDLKGLKKAPKLPIVDPGSLFSSLRKDPTAGLVLPSIKLPKIGEEIIPGIETYRQPVRQKLGNFTGEEEENSSILRKILSLFVSFLDWVSHNKEIMLGSYIVVLIIFFLRSFLKKK